MIEYMGKRELEVFYDGIWKVTIDPEEGSSSCECAEHTAWVLDPLVSPRCEHAAAAWRLKHAGGLLG